MAKNQIVSVAAKELASNEKGFKALKQMKGYNPSNKNYTLDKGLVIDKSLSDLQTEEAGITKALNDVIDKRIKAEWAVHNYMLGAANQVIAQYGDDSNEYESLGYKKKSDYKAPKRKPIPPTPPKAA